MPIAKKDIKELRKEEGTPGGATYYLILKRETIERAVCARPIPNQPGMYCSNEAGKGTWHFGQGACKYHGGNNVGPITTGKGARMAHMRLAGTIQSYLSEGRAKLLDLSYELATAKAIFDELVDNLPSVDDDKYGIWLGRLNTNLSTLANLAERISRSDNRNTLTAAQVMLLRATVADLFLKYIKDPDERDRAVKELAARMGGDVKEEVSIQPQELPYGYNIGNEYSALDENRV